MTLPNEVSEPQQEEQILDLIEFEINTDESKESEKEEVNDAEVKDETISENVESEAGTKSGEKVTEESKESLESEVKTSTTTDSVVSSEIEALKRQNQLLLEQIEKITERLSAQPLAREEKKEPEKVVESLDLIGELDIDEVVSDKKLFNQVISAGLAKIREDLKSELSAMIPGVASTHVNHAMTIKETTDNFYRENSDLVPVKKTVGRIAAEIYAEEPTITIQELYKKAADKTREVLGITRIHKSDNQNDKRERKPEFASAARSGDRSQGRDQIDPVQQDILETLGL